MSVMGLLSALFGWQPASADAAAAAAGQAGFCNTEFPEMWGRFVDHVVSTGYTRACTADADPQPPELPPLRLPAAKRLVAIGDLHGDLNKAKRAFRLAGLIDEQGRWSGKDTVCVQVGDILDRGDQEIKLLYMLESLQRQAAAAGGALFVLNGNHESMNVAGNFRYATQGADVEMAAWRRWVQLGEKLRSSCSTCNDGSSSSGGSGSSGMAGVMSIDAASSAADTPVAGGSGRSSKQFNPLREAALRPGGPITRRFFAPHPTVLQVGSTLFVHGGVLPSHVEYGLERINRETRAWLMGQDPRATSSSSSKAGSGSSSSSGDSSGKKFAPPAFLRGADAVVWARDYSARDESRCDCDTLQQVLESLPGAKRMVVGHTIQDRGINGACGGRVLRVDVGLSQGCGDGAVQVLEILGDGQQVVRLREGMEAQPLAALQQQQQQGHAQQQGHVQQQQQQGQHVQQQQQQQGVGSPQQHQQQQQQPSGVSGWVPQVLRALWTEQQGVGSAAAAAQQQQQERRQQVEPTPA